MKVVITIPTYNEIENIENTIKVLLENTKNIEKCNVHILVIDDSSPDGTASLVRELITKYPNLHLLSRKEKTGLGAAYKEGWDYAFFTMNADAVISFDADLSHDPKVIPQFIDAFLKGKPYVCGTRYRKGGGIPPEWGIHRKLMSYLGNLFIRILYFDSGLSDFTSGYKLISKEVYADISDELGTHQGYTFSISANLEPIRKGYTPYEVPYHFTDRTIGESKMGLDYLFNAFFFVIKMRIKDFFDSRFGRVIIAGAIGSIAQFASFGLLFKPLIEDRNLFRLPIDLSFLGADIQLQALIALLLSIEVGVFVSFYVNNLWAFKDHRLKGGTFWLRFLKNQFVVAGAIVIQLVVFQLLAWVFGRATLLDYVYQAIGILLGLIWNFYFYQRIIWKINKNES